MTLTFAGALDRSTVSRAVDLVSDLVRRPEVGAAWARESSCAGMTVGGLTRHLVSQPVTIVGLLRSDESALAGTEQIAVLEHYARAAWVREDLEGETNRSIRAGSDEQAAEGPEAAFAVLDQARAELEAVVAEAPPTTYIPWQGAPSEVSAF